MIKYKNKKAAGLLIYLFWMLVGALIVLFGFGKFICKYWCGC